MRAVPSTVSHDAAATAPCSTIRDGLNIFFLLLYNSRRLGSRALFSRRHFSRSRHSVFSPVFPGSSVQSISSSRGNELIRTQLLTRSYYNTNVPPPKRLNNLRTTKLSCIVPTARRSASDFPVISVPIADRLITVFAMVRYYSNMCTLRFINKIIVVILYLRFCCL